MNGLPCSKIVVQVSLGMKQSPQLRAREQTLEFGMETSDTVGQKN
jgi:hypothetical protein